jgi:hypothetical protein
VAHQEVPREDAETTPVGGQRKQRRGQNLAAGRRQKPETTQEYRGSRMKATVADRKVSRRAAVARRWRDAVRKELTQGACEPQVKKNTAAERGSITSSLRERSSVTDIQRKYIVERDPAPIQDDSGAQPVVASG